MQTGEVLEVDDTHEKSEDTPEPEREEPQTRGLQTEFWVVKIDRERQVVAG
jgi:hypothetical protein